MPTVARLTVKRVLALGMVHKAAIFVLGDALTVDIEAVRSKAEIDGRTGLQHGKAFHGFSSNGKIL